MNARKFTIHISPLTVDLTRAHNHDVTRIATSRAFLKNYLSVFFCISWFSDDVVLVVMDLIAQFFSGKFELTGQRVLVK